MRKFLLLGCLCVGGLMLAGADGGCQIGDKKGTDSQKDSKDDSKDPKDDSKDPKDDSKDPKDDSKDPKEDPKGDAEWIEACEAESAVSVRRFACDPESDLYEMTATEQEDLIKAASESCKNDKKFFDAMTGDYENCKRPNVAGTEACAEALKGVSCNAQKDAWDNHCAAQNMCLN